MAKISLDCELDNVAGNSANSIVGDIIVYVTGDVAEMNIILDWIAY